LDTARPQRASLSASDVAMVLVVCVWGSNYTVVKQSLDAFPPLAFMALRFGLAASAMLLVLLRLEGWPRLPLRTWGALAALGLVGNTAYQLCFILGLARTTAANSGLLTAVTPVLVAALAVAFKLERLTRPLLVGLALALAGMLLVVGSRGPSLSAETRLGDALILGGCLTWALYTVGVKALGAGLTPLQITALTMLTGAPPLLALGAPAVAGMDLGRPSALAWTGVAYSALVPLVVA
jgi:drug/metabolite transporter (DMT)-like permease